MRFSVKGENRESLFARDYPMLRFRIAASFNNSNPLIERRWRLLRSRRYSRIRHLTSHCVLYFTDFTEYSSRKRPRKLSAQTFGDRRHGACDGTPRTRGTQGANEKNKVKKLSEIRGRRGRSRACLRDRDVGSRDAIGFIQ